VVRIDRSATGGHIGLDLQYPLLEQISVLDSVGVGLLLRYGAASIDLPEVAEGSTDVGGFNYGFGLRLGF
jgi:hypothetical protein